jgi:DNA-directed RNA polymerase subunit N (RpoN/RPB10)
MIIPVRCFECGKLLADKWNYYQEKLREAKGNSYNKPVCFDGKTLPVTAEAEIFKQLQLTRYCCRKNLLTHVDLINKI